MGESKKSKDDDIMSMPPAHHNVEFSTEFTEHLSRGVNGELDANMALKTLAFLIKESADADKLKLDQIKCMDKLINSSRHILELMIKTQEALAVARRLDELELRLEEALGG